jgi:predicted CoA-binding protein
MNAESEALDRYADPRIIEDVLRQTHVWAVIGCSSNPIRPSHGVSRTLLSHGYDVIPVNPREQAVHGRQAFADLASAAEWATAQGTPIEVVDIFRRADLAGVHVDEAIAIGAKAVWLQLGVIDEEAARRAQEAGLMVIMDRCPAIELPRLGLRSN